jgi:hypothetical protein
MIKKITLISLAFATIGFSSCQQKQQADVSTNKIGINIDTLSLQTALRYVKNYKKNAGTVDSAFSDAQAVEKTYKGSNTRCIWFSVDRLQALVDSIKKEKGDGIRFYLATYDKSYSEDFKGGHKPEKQYWGYNTLVMVSTKPDSTTGTLIHQDYYGKNSQAGQNGGQQGFIVGSTPENRGEQCPPPATCKGATLLLLGN